MTKEIEHKRRFSFCVSLRMPVFSFFIIATVIVALAAALWYLKASRTHPIDVTWIYYSNFFIVYGLLVGAIAIFMAFSFKKHDRHPRSTPATRFLCLVPAYNEEIVIANSVKSLLNQNYPRSLFEVVVVFDGTDRVARELGAAVVKTPSNAPSNVGTCSASTPHPNTWPFAFNSAPKTSEAIAGQSKN